MLYELVGVQPIDVQKIDRLIFKIRQRLIEASPDQSGEVAVARIVIGNEVPIHLLTIKACLLVALPMIDSTAARSRVEVFNGLAKPTVGVACVYPELDEGTRTHRIDDPPGER